MSTVLSHVHHPPRREAELLSGAKICRAKFLRHFPGGFRDETYLAWERNYKLAAHERWEQSLGREAFRMQVRRHAWERIAEEAVRIESRTNLLFSFEKMSVRDAIKNQRRRQEFCPGPV
ncbi:MAG TPA: hypothetical protein VFE47_02295 [Tepidisphaeraceae bacterium]|jgi:hypothetical protein|nr:hypothetical protein [Tepidisphaeraceae bacterium]